MEIIRPLVLIQDRVDPLDSSQLTTRWYGWDTASGIDWDLYEPSRHTDREPDYACDVTTTTLMAGRREEIIPGIAAALRRHAKDIGIGA